MVTTANKGYDLPNVGGDANAWGTKLNADLGIVDLNLGGVAQVNVAGGVAVTPTAAQLQCLVHVLTGAITADINYLLPAGVGTLIDVVNSTTGNFKVTVTTGVVGGATRSVQQGISLLLTSDGTNVRGTMRRVWRTVGAAVTFANASAVGIALPFGYTRFRLTLYEIAASADGCNLGVQFSPDSGATYDSLTNKVSVLTLAGNSTIPSVFTSYITTATSIPITGTMSNSSTGQYDGTFDIYPGTVTVVPKLRGQAFFLNNTPEWRTLTVGGANGTSFVATALQIIPSAGTFSGSYQLEGLPLA